MSKMAQAPAAKPAVVAKVAGTAVEEVAQVALYHPAWLNAYAPTVKGLTLNIGLQFSSIDGTTLG